MIAKEAEGIQAMPSRLAGFLVGPNRAPRPFGRCKVQQVMTTLREYRYADSLIDTRHEAENKIYAHASLLPIRRRCADKGEVLNRNK